MKYRKLILPKIVLVSGLSIEVMSLYKAASTFGRTALDGILQVIGSLFGGYVCDYEGMPQGRGGFQGGSTYAAAQIYAWGIILGIIFIVLSICFILRKSKQNYWFVNKK